MNETRDENETPLVVDEEKQHQGGNEEEDQDDHVMVEPPLSEQPSAWEAASGFRSSLDSSAKIRR